MKPNLISLCANTAIRLHWRINFICISALSECIAYTYRHYVAAVFRILLRRAHESVLACVVGSCDSEFVEYGNADRETATHFEVVIIAIVGKSVIFVVGKLPPYVGADHNVDADFLFYRNSYS